MEKEPESNAWKKRKKMLKESLEKKTKTVTVYWSEIVFMKNTIEVPIDWTEKDIENDPDGIMFNGAKDYDSEIETDSIEIVEHD